MLKNVILILFITACIISCDLYQQDEFEEQYVVESYLIANNNLPQVRISRTLSIQAEYTFENVAVNDANVEIRLLNRSGFIEETYAYIFQSAGVYVPSNPEPVLSSRFYELYVTFSNNNDVIRSATFVPGQFHTVNNVVDSIEYQDPRQVVIHTTASNYPGRQSYFIFNVNAINPRFKNLTPFYADLVEEQDQEISDFYKNSSGIVNEENYDHNSDGTLTLRVPWLAVAFYENNEIIANAIDDNMYDFIRSQRVQSGGSTLPPGEFQNVIYNVEGGIGIFGSMATDTVRVYIRRNE